MLSYPTSFHLSSGTGASSYELVSFDLALIDAGISNYNLLKVSSILPIGCQQKSFVDEKEGAALLVAYGSISSDKRGDTIASAVAVGIPENSEKVGVIMECSGHYSSKVAENSVIEMVKEAMRSHGISCKQILSTSIEAVVEDRYVSVISAISLW